MHPPGKSTSKADGNTIPRYTNKNLENNQIREKGCKGLSKGNWPSFQEIDLGKNELKKVVTS